MTEKVRLRQPLRGLTLRPVAGLAPSAVADDPVGAAYERGLRDGERKLSEQLLAQRNEFSELQRGVIEALRAAVPRVVHETEAAVMTLALQAAQKLVAGLPITADMVEAIVREALGQVEDTAEIVVALHLDDLALLEKSGSPLLAPTATGPKMTVRAGPEVTRGGCVVHTRFGVVDARRETKAELLQQAVQG
ncbi:MAG TPA: FliH/SctL family protein [Verrucomicrobiae bacterium]|nr:FliH/SctL family protein [Verrucomicrobiae bacterium]